MAWHDELASFAHDLRAPLTVIAGTASALRKTADDDGRGAALDKIIHETQRLGRMLENRIVAARLVGDPLIEREWVPVEELAAGALARLEAAVGARRVELAIQPDAIAHVDPRLGELVIGNLVDNSARYTPATGGILIAARRDGAGVVIDVEDAGPGLPPQVRLDAGELARGKGLAVCRAIAIAHEGSLEFEHRDGGGLRARVRLPDAEPRRDMETALAEETDR